jgi:hypothetical protein
VSQESRGVVRDWLATLPDGIDWKVFDPGKNVWKYPLMRRMFHNDKPPMVMGAQVAKPPLTMWFDDDSHLQFADAVSGARFLNLIESEFTKPAVGMLGEIWQKRLLPGQEEWVKSRPWYAGGPVATMTRFATGGWWTIRTSLLRKFDWPDPTIRHNGGDTSLAQMLFQQKYQIIDIRGRHWVKVNDAPRRGENQTPAGQNFKRGVDVDLSHHDFTCQVLSRGADRL